eukprot:TRINITY_DN83495_c0_g1_i1.p1 TRINITY_DN83495_c0_g1~~TRINITY_DN83495_c0_g1_i1.p1  ORF type:complete len:243 (-),score=56.85 TRINITY_DN83495_c0_g1_i1:86-754(-)
MPRSRATLSCVALGGLALRFAVQGFVSITQLSPKEEILPRRDALLAASTVAALLPLPGWAADPKSAPKVLFVTGMSGTHSNANGMWDIVPGKDINGRATYKKDGAELFMMVNDCNQLQMEAKVTAECTGFARQKEKGKWTIDGNDVSGVVKVKALKPIDGVAKGATVVVSAPFRTDDTDVALRRGQTGVVKGVDPEGDTVIQFEGEKPSVVFKESLSNLKLV